MATHRRRLGLQGSVLVGGYAVAVHAVVIQIGVAPRRIDLLTSIDAVDFEDAWQHRLEVDVDGLRVPVIGRRHLILNKKAVGWPQDLADVARLEAEAPPST